MTAGQRDSTSGAKVSIWTRSAETPKYPVVPEGLTPDVCVVGAGIAGLSVAYTLAGEGLSVVVIDDGAVGSGETGRTSAHLANAVDDHYHVLESMHGEAVARVIAESHTAAIDRIEAIVSAGRHRLRIRTGRRLPVSRPRTRTRLSWTRNWPRRAGPGLKVGRSGTRPHSHVRNRTGPAVPGSGAVPSPALPVGSGRSRGPQGRAHLHRRPCRGNRRRGQDAQVTLKSGHVIRCKSIVVATNVPVNDRVAMHTKLEPYRTYVIAAHVPIGHPSPRPCCGIPGDPYHYVRIGGKRRQQPGQDLLLIGGEDHKTGQAADFDERYGATWRCGCGRAIPKPAWCIRNGPGKSSRPWTGSPISAATRARRTSTSCTGDSGERPHPRDHRRHPDPRSDPGPEQSLGSRLRSRPASP